MLEIRLLGQFEVQLDGHALEIPSRPVRLLLAHLALNPGVEHPREDLAALLWPDADPTTARSNLRNVLYKLREAVRNAPAHFQIDNETVALLPGPQCWVDAAVLRSRRPTGQFSVDELLQQVATYQGRLLPGYTENWVDVERMRLREAFERKMELLLKRLEADERWDDLRELSNLWIAKVEHTPEAAYRGLMTAYAGLGDRTRMDAAYKACAAALKKELDDADWEPAEETQALYERLRRSLKTSRPPSALPPEKPAAPARPALAERLQAPATPFIGRGRELAEIEQRLADPACRLVTLMGPGGIGKTRLALQAASAQTAYADGVHFVPLVDVHGADGLVWAIADALGLVFAGRGRPRQQLTDYLREKQLLLVLDNCEHLVAEASLVDDLLSAAPAVKVLATSRERLRLPAEWLLDLDGLDYPSAAAAEGADAASLAAFGAVQVFLQTARRLYSRTAFDHEMPAIARICRLVEGLPLAIEMAAAWVRALPCDEIARQIDATLTLLAKPLPHVPARQHSVRAVFEHSWNLLSEAEQAVFRHLAVFAGGFQKEAAEKVADAPLALLLSLVDKSFLRRNPDGRFELHELLRQFAAERLRATPDADAVERRLAHFFLEYASVHAPHAPALEREWDNLSAGLQAAQRHRLWAMVLGYAEALSDAWFARNRLSEARQAYAWARQAAEALNYPHGLASVLARWGHACLEQSDYAEAKAQLEESLTLSRANADTAGTATALYFLGYLAVEQAHFAEAEQLLKESLQLREALADQRGIAEALYQQACNLYYLDRHAQVAEHAARALAIQRAVDDQRGCIKTLLLLANSYVERRNAEPDRAADWLAQAQQACQEAYDLCRALDDRTELARALRQFADIYKWQGNLTAALDCAGRALELSRVMGDRRAQAIGDYELSMIHAKLGDFGAALQAAQRSAAQCEVLGDHFGSIYALTLVGDAQLGLGDSAAAGHTWQSALDQALAFATPHPQTELLRQRLHRPGQALASRPSA